MDGWMDKQAAGSALFFIYLMVGGSSRVGGATAGGLWPL